MALLPCGPDDLCTACDLVFVANNVFSFLVKVTLGIAVLAAIVAGVLYITSTGSTTWTGRAKKALKYALIGFALSLLAWVGINVLAGSLGYKGPQGNWWELGEFQCSWQTRIPMGIRGANTLEGSYLYTSLGSSVLDLDSGEPFSVYLNPGGENVSHLVQLASPASVALEKVMGDNGEEALRLKMAAAGLTGGNSLSSLAGQGIMGSIISGADGNVTANGGGSFDSLVQLLLQNRSQQGGASASGNSDFITRFIQIMMMLQGGGLMAGDPASEGGLSSATTGSQSNPYTLLAALSGMTKTDVPTSLANGNPAVPTGTTGGEAFDPNMPGVTADASGCTVLTPGANMNDSSKIRLVMKGSQSMSQEQLAKWAKFCTTRLTGGGSLSGLLGGNNLIVLMETRAGACPSATHRTGGALQYTRGNGAVIEATLYGSMQDSVDPNISSLSGDDSFYWQNHCQAGNSIKKCASVMGDSSALKINLCAAINDNCHCPTDLEHELLHSATSSSNGLSGSLSDTVGSSARTGGKLPYNLKVGKNCYKGNQAAACSYFQGWAARCSKEAYNCNNMRRGCEGVDEVWTDSGQAVPVWNPGGSLMGAPGRDGSDSLSLPEKCMVQEGIDDFIKAGQTSPY